MGKHFMTKKGFAWARYGSYKKKVALAQTLYIFLQKFITQV